MPWVPLSGAAFSAPPLSTIRTPQPLIPAACTTTEHTRAPRLPREGSVQQPLQRQGVLIAGIPGIVLVAASAVHPAGQHRVQGLRQAPERAVGRGEGRAIPTHQQGQQGRQAAGRRVPPDTILPSHVQQRLQQLAHLLLDALRRRRWGRRGTDVRRAAGLAVAGACCRMVVSASARAGLRPVPVLPTTSLLSEVVDVDQGHDGGQGLRDAGGGGGQRRRPRGLQDLQECRVEEQALQQPIGSPAGGGTATARHAFSPVGQQPGGEAAQRAQRRLVPHPPLEQSGTKSAYLLSQLPKSLKAWCSNGVGGRGEEVTVPAISHPQLHGDDPWI